MTSIILLVSALIALCTYYTRTHKGAPTQAFLASFTTAPVPSNVRVLHGTTWTMDHTPVFTSTPVYAMPDEVEASLARLAHECETDERAYDLPRLTHKMEHFVQVLGSLEVAQDSAFERACDDLQAEIDALIPAPTQTEAALCALMGLDWNDPSMDEEIGTHTVIEHLTPKNVTMKASTERMRAQRAAYAAQGLTARGTVPQPPCNGTVKDPSNRHGSRSCKRKSVGAAEMGWTKGGFCSLEHANQYGLGLVWSGEETMEQAKARITGLSGLIQHAGIDA